MPLSPASRFGPYEILGPLGAGGMGEVYRARDTRLGREVALKVLPSEVSSDPARRARFEQEARAAAALNHPNIVGLLDVGEENGVYYIVSELVPGETLDALLQGGPLPVRKLLDIAAQLADGMAAAHTARITHRDLKPSNVIVTPEGRVKILDFGLAKQTALAAAAGDATLTVHQTQPGVIMGTVHYMSPEQARGRAVDHRSDQFSFGLILYEMATGRRAFDKPETVQILSAILTEEPPPIERDLSTPLRWTIDRCLSKNSADRYESSGDLFRELRQIRDHYSAKSTSQTTTAVTAPAPHRRRIRWIFPVIGTAGLIGAFFLGRALTTQPSAGHSALSFTPFAFDPGVQGSPVWSPDGKAVAYAGHPNGAGAPSQVMVHYLDQPAARRVTGVSRDATPLGWTPDSSRIFFWSAHEPAGIWSVSAVGGEVASVHQTGSLRVAVSPDAKSVAVLQPGEDGVYAIHTASPPGSPLRKYPGDTVRTRDVFNGPQVRFAPDGRSILVTVLSDRDSVDGWLMPYPPDPARPPRRVLPDLRSLGRVEFSWMPDSRRIVLALAGPDRLWQLWLADLSSGVQTQITSGTLSRTAPAVSPTGDRIVFAEPAMDFDIVSVDLQRGVADRSIATGRSEEAPAWAANARVMAYLTDRAGPSEVWIRDQGGDRPVVSPKDFPSEAAGLFMAPALSPDGSRVIYSRNAFNGLSRSWISSTSGGAPVRLTNDDSTSEFPGSWSPDGSWFAYHAARAGSRDLIKVRTSGQAAPILLKPGIGGVDIPQWSPSGEWIVINHQLISSDGKTVRELPQTGSTSLTFSRDGKLLYGIRHEPDAEIVFSLDVASGAQKTIARLGPEFRPVASFRPGVHFSLSPDGQSIAYSVATRSSNLWMVTGALKP